VLGCNTGKTQEFKERDRKVFKRLDFYGVNHSIGISNDSMIFNPAFQMSCRKFSCKDEILKK
jgi:hypothetical protein